MGAAASKSTVHAHNQPEPSRRSVLGYGGQGGGLGEAHATARLSGVAEAVGGGADLLVALSEQEDEPMDYERLCASAEAFIYAAMVRLMARRLARV